MNFNFSKQEPIKSNEKKTSILGKLWAGLNLISLLGDFIMPKKAKDNIPVKVRNIIILILLLILVYLIGCGIIFNIQWIALSMGNILFELGDGFYYYGIVVIIFMALDFFNMDQKLIDHATQKKKISEALQYIGKDKPDIKAFIQPTQNKRIINTITGIVSFITFLWAVWGIIFYDRLLFSMLIALSLVFAIIVSPVKKIEHVKKVMISEIIINIILLIIILINHFYLTS